MLEKHSHSERLYILAKACMEKNVNPEKGNYAGFVRGICAGELFIRNKAAQELIEDLTLAYRYDKWQCLLETENETEQPQETATYTLNKIVLQPPRVNPLKNLTLNEPLQPVKTVQPKTLDMDAEKYLTKIAAPGPTEKQYAQIFYAKAEHDILNGIGRITLSDAKEITKDNITVEQVQSLLQTYYVDLETEIRGNLLLIYFDGKSTVRSLRDLDRAIQPKNPVYHPKENPEGDITEEDEGVVSDEQASGISEHG